MKYIKFRDQNTPSGVKSYLSKIHKCGLNSMLHVAAKICISFEIFVIIACTLACDRDLV